MSVAVVTAAVARGLDDDLPPLADALGRRGIAHELVDWDDPSVDWGTFELAVVRSVWDYPRRRDELLAWTDRVAALTPLHNPPPILRWSSDKRYLGQLTRAGVPIVPTAFAAPGEAMEWPDGEVVVKPVVSAGSLDTERHPAGDRAGAEAHVARLHADGRAAMAQPYMAGVEAAGETAMVHLNGSFSHAVRKGPLLVPGLAVVGDLFVEEDISPASPTPDQAAVARAALSVVPGGGGAGLLYARVDLVPGPDGEPLVIELELLEPSLFLAHAPGAADHLAHAIAERL